MIQYYPKNSSYKDDYNFNSQYYSISDYNLQSENIYQNWISLTPNNMNDYLSEDKKFRVLSNIQSTKPVYYAFNHKDGNQADLGLISNNNIPEIYFQFYEKTNISSVRFTLVDIKNPFKLVFSYSNDNNIWVTINEYIIGCNNASNSDEFNNVVHFFNKSNELSFLKYNPNIICEFDNKEKYNYYKLSFVYLDDYHNSQMGLKISKMFLYDSYYILSPIFNFPLKNNNKDLSGVIIGDDNNVNFNGYNLQLNDDSNIVYSPYLLNGLNDTTITFDAKISGDKCQGQFISKNSIFSLSYKQIILNNKSALTFLSLQQEGKFSISFNGWDSIDVAEFYYSINKGETWDKLYIDEEINLKKNESLMLINNNDKFCVNNNYRYSFNMIGKFKISGDIMSLVNFKQNTEDNYQFYQLFKYNNSIVDASELILSAKKLSNNCYYQMFIGCQELISAPIILADELSSYCCYEMFYNCIKLINAPSILPATTLAPYCYYNMFYNCTSLTQAPELPATTLTEYCYRGMFRNCYSLYKAPYLPATNLVYGCYHNMFDQCHELNEISAAFTCEWNSSYTSSWLTNVSQNGTFHKSNENKDFYQDYYGIPYGWNVDYKLNEPAYEEIQINYNEEIYISVEAGYADENKYKYSLSGKYYLQDNKTFDMNCIYKCDNIINYYEYQKTDLILYIKLINGYWTFIDNNEKCYLIADKNIYNNPCDVEKWMPDNSIYNSSNYVKLQKNNNIDNIIFLNFMSRNQNEKKRNQYAFIYSSKLKNQWHHYTLTFGKQFERLLIDNKQVSSKKALSNKQKNIVFQNTNKNNFIIGTINQNNKKVKLQMKNLSIYSYELSSNKIQKDMYK